MRGHKICFCGEIRKIIFELSFFNSISVISGQWADDNERLCTMEPCLQLRRFCFEQGLNSGTVKSVGSALLRVQEMISYKF